MFLILGLGLILIFLTFYLKRTPLKPPLKPQKSIIHIQLYDNSSNTSNYSDLEDFWAEPITGIDIHNTTVQSSTRQGILKLKEWYTKSNIPTDKSQSVEEIKTFLFQPIIKLNTKVRELAYNTLRTIIKVNGALSEVNLTEYEVLHIIWQRINAPLNKKNHMELITAFIESLAEGSTSPDTPYCITGRVTQIVQSLETLDQEGLVNIITLDYFKEQIKNKFPCLLQDYFRQADEKDKKIYEAQTATETEVEEMAVKNRILTFIDTHLRQAFSTLSEKDYSTVTKDYFMTLQS